MAEKITLIGNEGFHIHAPVTSSTNGFMIKTDKAFLDASTAAKTPSTLMERDSNGQAKVSAPTDPEHIARKQDVDNLIITTGKIAPGAVTPIEMAAASLNAANHTYSGSVEFASNVKQAIDLTKQRVDNIVAGAGASNTEIIDARQPATGTAFPILRDRLNNTDAQLADIAINVSTFGAVGDGVADDTAAIQAAIDYVFVQGGGVVIFGAKTYKFSTLYLKSKVALEGRGGKSTVLRSSNTGTAVFIQGTPTTPNEWISISGMVIQATSVTNAPVIYMDAAYYIEFTDVNVFGNNTTTQPGSIGIHIRGSDTGYYGTFTRSQFAWFEKGVKLESSANAHRILSSWFYECTTCIEIIDSNGILIQGNTFQDFFTKGISLSDTGGGKTRGNMIAGNYFEYKFGSPTIVCAVEIATATTRTTMFYGNNYTNFRPSHPEVIDNGVFTSRLEFSGTSYYETLKIANFMIPPTFAESSKPIVDAAFRGGIALTTEASKQDKIRAVVRDRNGVMQWVEIPYFVSGALTMPDNASIQNGAIYQYNDGFILLGTQVNAQQRALNYDTGFKMTRFHDGVDWRYLQGIRAGTTANRPTIRPQGMEYFDTSLNKPIWWNGTVWVDATGTTV